MRSKLRIPEKQAFLKLLLLFILIISIKSQCFATSYTSNGNGDWNTAGNWNPGGVPGPGDVVSIKNNAITLSGTASCASISYQNSGSTLALNAGAILSVSGSLAAGTNLTCDAASTINFNGTAAQTIPVGTYGNIKISNTSTAGATFAATSITTSNVLGTLTIDTGGKLALGSGITYTGVPLTVNSNGILTVASSLPSGLSTSFDPTSKVIFNAAGAQTIPVYTYGILDLAGSGIKTVSSGVSVKDITFNGGSLTVGSGSTLNISGSLASGGTTILTGSTINFNGTTSQTIPAYTFGNIIVNNTSPVGASFAAATISASNVPGTLTVNSGSTLAISGTLQAGLTTSFNPSSKVIFNAAGAQTIPVYTYGILDLAGSGIKTVSSGVSVKDITFNGGSLTVGSGSTLNISGSLATGGTTTLTGSTINFNGTSGIQVIPVYSYTNLQASGAATKTLSGSLSVKDITISGGALTIGSGQILSVSGSLPASTSLLFDPASTVNFNGTSAQTIPANTYGNIKINNAAGATLGMNLTSTNLKGNLIVESGILDNGIYTITGTAGQTLQVDNGASLALSNSSTFPGSFGTVTLGATSNTIYQGAAQVIDSRTYGNLQINGTAGKTLNGNVIANNVSFGGSAALAVGASQTFTVNGSLPASAPITLDPASTVTFSGAAVQTIPINSYGTLVLDKAANKTLAGNITVKDISFTGTGSGTLTVAASQTINISGSLPAAAPLTLDAASTINFNGTSAQIIPVYTYGNIKINNTGGVTLGGALTSSNLKGNLTIESGKFDNGGFNLAATSGKTLQVNNGATLVLSGITTFPTSFSTVTLQPSSTVNFNGFGAQNIPNYTYGNIKINNTSSSGATLGMSVTAANVLGSIVVESGTLSVDNLTTITGVPLTVNNSATMAVAGDFSTFVVTLQPTSTINFNGTSAQIIPSYTYGNIKINNTSSGGAALGMNVTTSNVTGNIAVESGVLNIGSATTIIGTPIFVSNSSTLAVAGNFPASAVTLQVSSILNFNGASTQNIPSRSYGILKFTGAGTKTLDGNITAGNTLVASPIDLSNGGIDIGGNTLTLNTAGSISGASTANYIKLGTGKMIIENLGSTGRDGEWLFPVGTTSSYTPASIINAGANNDFSVNVVDGIKDRFNNVVNNNVVKKTWNVSRETSNGAVDVTLKLQWNNTDEAYDAAIPTNTFNRNTSTINHYENGGWNQVATSSLVEIGTTYSVTASGIKTFSPFGVADNNNPLPVELSYFKAINNAGKAKLEWATATEKNNKGFNIQVSADGKRFENIGFIASKNENSTSLQQYEFNDKENRTGLWYFRLQQVDLSGEVNYSGSKVIDFGIRASSVQVYPNPCQNELAIKIDLIAASDTEIQLRDLAGKTVASQVQKLFPGSTTIPLNIEKDKPSGVYILTIKTGTEVFTNKIIKL